MISNLLHCIYFSRNSPYKLELMFKTKEDKLFIFRDTRDISVAVLKPGINAYGFKK